MCSHETAQHLLGVIAHSAVGKADTRTVDCHPRAPF